MHVVVCAKAVPGYVTNVKVAETKDRVDYRAGSIIINESDEYALEEALALKKKFGGKVTVISAGTLQCQQILYTCLAKGADQVIRVDVNWNNGGIFSAALAQALSKIDYDLILTGIESSDNMATQVPVAIAQRLNIPFANAVTDIEVNQRSRTITATKELGGGIKQLLEMPLPALLCIQSGILPLSYPPFQKVLKARATRIECLSLKELDLGESEIKDLARLEIEEVFPPRRIHQTEFFEGEPGKVARLIIEKMGKAL